MGKSFYSYSIKGILLLYMFVFIIINLLSSTISNIFTVKPLSDMMDEIKEKHVYQLNATSYVFKEKIKNLEILADIIESMYIIDGTINVENGIDNVLNSFMEESNDITGCIIVNSDNSVYKFGLKNEEIDIIQLRVMCNRDSGKNGDFVWYNMTSAQNEYLSYLYNKHIIASTKFIDANTSNTVELYILMDANSFSNIISTENDENIVAIIEQENNVLYSNNEAMYNEIVDCSFENMQKIYSINRGFYTINEGGKTYTAIIHPLDETDFKFIKIYEEDIGAGYITSIIFVNLITLLIILSLSVYIYRFINNNYIRSFNFLADKMTDFIVGDTKERIGYTVNKEVNLLIEKYNNIVDNFNKIICDIKKKEYDKKKFELNALKYQIKPHFLYNTLNSIRILALKGEQVKVSESIRLLGRILKKMLSETEQEIKISEEMEFIKNYIDLMQIRFKDCIKVEYSIDEEVNECKIPALMLQPIVENAIEHGLAEKLAICDDNTKIFIRAKRVDDKIEIEITDNGIGMSEETLKSVIKNKENINEESIGLYNVNSRLKLLYGENSEIRIESKQYVYTSVTVIMPFNEDENF